MSTEAIGRTQGAVITGDAATNRSSIEASLLAEPASDPTTALMQVMVKLGQEQKKADRAEEKTAEAAMKADTDKRVQDMHDKAADIMAEGIVGGMMGIASAAMTAGAAIESYSAKMDGIDAQQCEANAKYYGAGGDAEMPAGSHDAIQTSKEFSDMSTNMSTQAASTELKGAWMGVGAQAMNAGKEIVTAAFRSGQANDDANAAQAEGASHLDERRANDARDNRKAADDDIRFVLEWFKKLNDTTNQTTLQIAQRV